MDAMGWAALIIAFLFLSKLFTTKLRKRPLNLPPGPKPWPIIGNLNLLGHLPHQSLHCLSQKFGPIMLLKLGSQPVLVASSPEMAKEILRTHDHIFASRPPTAIGKHVGYNYRNILSAPYGAYWRQGRKIFLNELLSSRKLESFHYIRKEEMASFISGIYKLSVAAKPVPLKAHIYGLNLSVVSRITLGKKYFGTELDSDSENENSVVKLKEFHEMLEEALVLLGAFNIGDWIPWLDFLDLQGYVKRMKALRVKLDRFFDHVIDEHKAKIENMQTFVPEDIVDTFLKLADDPDLGVKFGNDTVKGFLLDIFTGGTDTTTLTLEWAMSELIKHPDLIKKAVEELDRVIGKERWVEEKDSPQLSYVAAILKETMRMHPVASMLTPHYSTENVRIQGYDIPKGTTVFVHTWSMGRNHSLWENPEEFRPERFLDKAIDIMGQNFELLPFGSGRRICPGYSLGLKIAHSSLANLLHGFTWRLPDNMSLEDLNMDEVYGLPTRRKFPLVAMAEPRLPFHLY